MTAAALALLVTGLLAGPAAADQSFAGRWAADPHACTGALEVRAQSLHWRDADCAIRTSYRVRDTWHIAARCLADGAVASVPVKLQRQGERLLVDWAGTAPEELRRCP
jgi:hypothetical protein